MVNWLLVTDGLPEWMAFLRCNKQAGIGGLKQRNICQGPKDSASNKKELDWAMIVMHSSVDLA